MPDAADYWAYFPKILNAVTAAPVTSGIYGLNENNHQDYQNRRTRPNTSPLPIRTVTLVQYTTSNPTDTLDVQGSMDGINWFTLGIPGGNPSVGAARRDSLDAANCLFVRLSLSAMSAGNLSCDLLLQGTPS